MSKANPGQPRSEPMLSTALQELSRSGPQSAPPELGDSLAAAFHRHHLRRRVIRRAATLAVALAMCIGLLWLRLGNQVVPDAMQVSIKPSESLKQPASTENPNAMTQPGRNRTTPTSARARRVLHASTKANSAAISPFVALPLFAFRAPQEELRIVRVEMPASSLRLLGAHVNDEISARRVTADLLVGPDGTAYAFRLVT